MRKIFIKIKQFKFSKYSKILFISHICNLFLLILCIFSLSIEPFSIILREGISLASFAISIIISIGGAIIGLKGVINSNGSDKFCIMFYSFHALYLLSLLFILLLFFISGSGFGRLFWGLLGYHC